MKNVKRILAIVLALCMILSSQAITILATEIPHDESTATEALLGEGMDLAAMSQEEVAQDASGSADIPETTAGTGEEITASEEAGEAEDTEQPVEGDAETAVQPAEDGAGIAAEETGAEEAPVVSDADQEVSSPSDEEVALTPWEIPTEEEMNEPEEAEQPATSEEEQSVSNETELVTPETAEQPVLEEVEQSTPEETVVGDVIDQVTTVDVNFLDLYGDTTKSAEAETGEVLTATIALTHSDPIDNVPAYAQIKLDYDPDLVEMTTVFNENNWSNITFEDPTSHAQTTLRVFYDTTNNTLTYEVPHGATLVVDLTFATKNGVTPDDTKVTLTPTLVEEDRVTPSVGENDEVGDPATGTWNADFSWDPIDKKVNGQDSNKIALNNDGTFEDWLHYSFTANSGNNEDAGAIWTDYIIVEDTLKLPEGFSFDDSVTISETDETVLCKDGIEVFDLTLTGTLGIDYNILALTIDNNTIYFQVKIYNTNKTTREINNLNFSAELDTAIIKTPEGYASGNEFGDEIVNVVDVYEFPVTGDSRPHSFDSVITTTSGNEGYDVYKDSSKDDTDVQPGDTIDYTISLKNTGANTLPAVDDNGNPYTVTDTLPNGVYLTAEQQQALRTAYGDAIVVTENTITYTPGEMAAGTEIVIAFNATVRDADALASMQIVDNTPLTNTVYYRDDSSHVMSRVRIGEVTVYKTKNTTEVLKDGDTASFSITVANDTDYSAGITENMTDTLPAYLPIQNVYQDTDNDGQPNGDAIDFSSDAAKNQTYSNVLVLNPVDNTYYRANISVDGNGKQTMTIVVDSDHGLGAHKSYTYGYTVKFLAEKVTSSDKVDECGVVTYTNVATLENGKKDDEPIEGEVGKLGVDKTADSAVDAEGNTVDVNGELEDGAVVDYSIEVSNDADHPYRQDIVVTDTLPAGTFPVGLKTTDGTEINTIDEYYAARNNNKSFTLDGVAVGVSENNKALTITWTIENPTGTGQLVGVGTPYKISYKAKVVTDYINSTAAGVKTLTNKVTVGPESDTAKIKVNAKGLAIEKYAVIDEEEVKNVTVTDSKEVTYKLRITNQKNTDLMANNVWDILPSWDADSSAGTVASSQYWQLGETVIVADDEDDFNDHWYYSNGQIGLNNNYLTWSQLKVPANTTLEQKVTLIFPDNVKATVFKGKETSDNQFQIEGTDPEKVTHEPESHKKYSLQKSVAALSGLNEHNQKYGFSSKDIFLVGETKYVYYAVTFFNTGEGDILLKTLEDDLPVGLTYVGMVNRDYKAGVNGGPEYSTDPITTLDYSDCVVTPDGYGWQGSVNLSATANGQKISIAVNDGEGAVIKEKKGIYFYIMATISDTVEEGEDLTNTVRATVEGDSELNPLYHELMNTPDDEVKNNGDIVDAGKTAEGDNIVESSVTIHPKNVVVPGIEKTASAYSETGVAGTWKDLDHTTNINSQNYIKWTIKLYNDGTIPLKNYTVTDNLHHYEKFVRVDSFIIKNAAGTPTHDGDYATDDAFIIDPLQTGSTNTENNKIIVFEIRDDKYAIPAGGYATMELVTTYISGQFYGLIDNWAMLKPDEEFDANSVRHGQLEKEATDTSERYAGVSSSDYVNALGAAGTVSEKIIYEKDNTSNKGEGNLGNVNKHFIYVDGTDDLVTYVNHIQNVSEYALKTLVMIDRLPEIGDAGVVNRTARDSEFTVDLAEAMNLKVELLDENGETKFTLTQGTDFTIEYSEKTGFEDGDFGFYEDNTYAGISNEGWSTTQTGAKSFRIRLIPDKVEAKLLTVFPDGLGDGDHVLPSGWALNVTYDGKISDDATPGQFAWNSFGYRYQVAGFDPLTAEPPKVGVGIPPQPILKKVVVNDEDVDQGVNEDAKFHFMVYELNEDGVNWTKLWDEPVEIAQGKTFDLKAKRTINGETTGDFIDGKTYRFIEVPDSSYEVYYWSVNDLKSTDTLDSFDIYENIHYVDVEFKEYEDIIVVCGNILPRGELGVTKTFQKNGALDTTYNGTVKVGLFTKDEQSQADDSYTKVEEKQITITNGQGSVTFPDLDLGTYYVFELDDDGNRVGTTYGQYKVTGSGSTVTFNKNSASADVQIINNKEEGQITVNKTVKYNGETDTDADNLTFDVALYTKEGETYNLASETQTITVTDGQGSTTFEHLALGTYYVFEMNGAERVDTLLGTYAVTGSGEAAKLEQAGDSKTVNIINAKTETGKITVNKTVKYNGAVDTENAEDFYVGLFKTNDEGSLEQVDETKKISTTAGAGSVDFTGLALGTYTVYEMKDGQRITDGKLGDYTVTGSGTEVTPARGDLEKTVEIVNSKSEKGQIVVTKAVLYNGATDTDADDIVITVALFDGTGEDAVQVGESKEITVSDGQGTTTFDNLDFGVYYVYEMNEGTRVDDQYLTYTVEGSGTRAELTRTSKSASVAITNKKTETGKITVNKTVKYNGAVDTENAEDFYVGLFKTNDEGSLEQVDETKKISTTAGAGSVDFTGLALGTYTVYEMKDGQRITDGKLGDYTVTGSGTEVTPARGDLEKTVEIINAKTEKGKITVDKTVKYNGQVDMEADSLTFDVALFTDEEGVIKKASDVQTITVTDGKGSTTFNDLDFDTYYVYEMDGDQRVEEELGAFTVSGSGTEVALARTKQSDEVEIVNAKTETGEIEVTKSVFYNGQIDTINSDTFTVGLFTKDGENYEQVGATQTFTMSSGTGKATFPDLALGTYYVFEMDGADRVENKFGAYSVTGSGTEVAITRTNLKGTAEIINSQSEKGEIVVTKKLLYNGVADTTGETSEVKVGLFTKDGEEYTKVREGTISLTAGTGNCVFSDLDFTTYYVYELDESGNSVDDTFGSWTVTGSGTSVELARDSKNGQVTITNDQVEKGQITVNKTVKYNGVLDTTNAESFSVAIFTKDGEELQQVGPAKSIQTAEGVGSVTFDDLDLGTYYVYELDEDGNCVGSALESYTVTGSGAQATLGRGALTATLEIVNELVETGKITVNKTVKYNGETDTENEADFDVALFKLGLDNGLQQVGEIKTITTSDGVGSVDFDNLELGTYCVYEMHDGIRIENGKLGDYTVSGSGTDVTLVRGTLTGTVDVVNAKSEKGQIVVDKTVKYNGETDAEADGITFDVAIFTRDGDTYTQIGDAKTITVTDGQGSVTFTDVDFGTYYVFELDAEGNPVNTTYNPYVVTNSGTEVTLSRTSKSATVGIINAQEEKGSVTVNKTVKYAGEVNTNSSESFNVGLFRKDGSEYTQVGETKTIQTEAGTGSVTFGDLVFGTYYVFELDAEGNRVSDVLGKYDVTGSGTQAVLSRASKTAEVNIVNNEKAPTVVKFSGTKTLTGKTLEDGKFTFELREGTDASADPIQTATNKNGKFEFTELSFDATGTYQYMITEHIPEEGDADYIKGVTYDSTVYNVTVTVEAGENAYTATITGLNTDGSGADFDFTNSYVPSSTYAIFEGTKTFEDYPTGKTPPTFEFILSENGSEIDRTSTVGSGTFKFDSITYDSVGNHTYTVVEKKITAGGVTCDETEYTVKVAVTDVGGELKATVSDNAKKLDFTNTYEAKPVSVGFEAHKTLKDSNGEKTLKGGEYAFALKDAENVIRQTKTNDAAGNVAFDAISFSKAGTYTYTISENIPDKKAGGITYSTEVYTVTVEVTDDGTGQLAAEKTVTDSEGAAVTLAEFENVYDATGSFTLKGEKELTGREFRTGDSFTFTVTGSDGAPLPTPAAVTINPTSGTTAAIEFTAIGYGIKDVGKTYTYTVTESGSGEGITNDIGTHTVEVKISDNGDGTLKVEETYSDGEALAFENTYDATGESVLKGAKTLTGREFKEGDSFTFTVTGSDGAPLPDPAAVTIKPTSGYSAEFEFAAISYGLADVGKTYTYTVTETGSGEGITNDTGTHTVTVTVADNYDGTLNIGETYSDGTSLAFVNKYTVSGQAEILAKKNFTGRAWKDGDAFTFKLEAVDGAPLPETTEITVTNDTVTGFGNMTYDAVGTYEYKVTEVVPEDAKKLPGVTYTDKAQTVKVVATDPNLNGELVMEVTYEDKDKPYAEFTNTYKAGPTEQVLKATKVLEGGELTADAFSFVLTDSEGKVLETVKNKADGSITFSAIPYTFEDLGGATEKSFTYTITEVEGSLTGYVYDLTVHKAVVTVKDNPATGKLEASVVYDPSTNDSSTASSTTDSDATSADTGSTSSATTAETIPVITNKTIEFLFNKVDATGTKEIAGAVMVLYYVDDSGKEKELTRWTSKVSEVWNFGPALECGGKYILREELAPTGYGRVTQDIEITVAADGTITTGLTTATDTDGNKIYLLADNAIRVPILKTVAGTTTPLKGAELVVYELDSKGKEVTNASGEKVEVVRWVTKAAVQDIGGYLDGGKTYKLVELKAPSGYNKFADVTFTVAEDGTITTSMKSVESSGTVIYIVEDTKMLTPTPTPTTKKTPTPTPVKRTTITPRPTVTTTVSKTTTSRTTSAKTGDDSPIEAYLLLLVAAAAVIAVTKRRTNANR